MQFGQVPSSAFGSTLNRFRQFKHLTSPIQLSLSSAYWDGDHNNIAVSELDVWVSNALSVHQDKCVKANLTGF